MFARFVGATLPVINRLLGTTFTSAPGETGSGALVRATSPSIATATLTGTTTAAGINSSAMSALAAFNYAADAGANDDYTITLSPAPAAYTTGMMVIFKANTANTTGATINVNGLGAKAIVKSVSTALSTNDILASMFCVIVYDGTNFVLMNPRAL